jgi:hypothetical protein
MNNDKLASELIKMARELVAVSYDAKEIGQELAKLLGLELIENTDRRFWLSTDYDASSGILVVGKLTGNFMGRTKGGDLQHTDKADLEIFVEKASNPRHPAPRSTAKTKVFGDFEKNDVLKVSRWIKRMLR